MLLLSLFKPAYLKGCQYHFGKRLLAYKISKKRSMLCKLCSYICYFISCYCFFPMRYRWVTFWQVRFKHHIVNYCLIHWKPNINISAIVELTCLFHFYFFLGHPLEPFQLILSPLLPLRGKKSYYKTSILVLRYWIPPNLFINTDFFT